jgi:hypothetical protein
MVSGLLAALAAIFAALFAVAAPDPAPDRPQDPPAAIEDLPHAVEDLRSAIRAFVQETLATHRLPEAPADDPPSGAIEPLSGTEGCQSDKDSGDGWLRMSVRCLQRSMDGGSSSISVSSSSNVTVKETSSDDLP